MFREKVFKYHFNKATAVKTSIGEQVKNSDTEINCGKNRISYGEHCGSQQISRTASEHYNYII